MTMFYFIKQKTVTTQLFFKFYDILFTSENYFGKKSKNFKKLK